MPAFSPQQLEVLRRLARESEWRFSSAEMQAPLATVGLTVQQAS